MDPQAPMRSPLRLRAKRQRLLLLCAGAALLAVSAVIALRALEDNLIFFYTPSMLLEKPMPRGETFRLGGLVERGSVTRQGGNEIAFAVSDGAASFKVLYRGIPPGLFREGQGVVAEGALRGDGVFMADTLLAKHDENYMPPGMRQALEKNGMWKPDAGAGADAGGERPR